MSPTGTLPSLEGPKELGFPFLSLPARPSKPRDTWSTIVAERGLPPVYQRDFLRMRADIIDYVKMTDHPGNIAGYPRDIIEEKIGIYHEFGVKCYLGGMLFEVAYMQGKVRELLNRAADLGFKAVELSESLLPRPVAPADRDWFIKAALDKGFEVFTEVGRKFPGDTADRRNISDVALRDLKLGVRGIIIECGEVRCLMRSEATFLTDLLKAVENKYLYFEVAHTEEQCFEAAAWVIDRFGSDVNVGNVGDQHVIILDAMRRGMAPENQYPYLRRATNRPPAGLGAVD